MKIEELINSHYDILNENDFHIYQYIINNPKEVQNMTIYELAEKCYISHTNIFRFAKKIGLDGFGELKMQLKWEQSQKKTIDCSKINRITNEYNDIINDLLNKNIDELLKNLHAAKRVYIYVSDEAHRHGAQEMKREFIRIGKLMIVVDNLSELKIILNHASKNDLFIIFSQLGDNESSINLAKTLKKSAIPSLGIALNYKSELAKYVNYYIGYKTEWIQLRKEEQYHSSILLFLIANMLFIKYIEFSATIEC